VYEHRSQPLLTKRKFAERVRRHASWVLVFLAGSLAIGVAGYMTLANLGFVDALLNASMILGGMGPVDTLTSNSAKVFASVYALYSGVAFLGSVGFLFAPFAHRVLHKLHLEGKKPKET
jgi:hypothetical protein